jgi:hypothetical protein
VGHPHLPRAQLFPNSGLKPLDPTDFAMANVAAAVVAALRTTEGRVSWEIQERLPNATP